MKRSLGRIVAVSFLVLLCTGLIVPAAVADAFSGATATVTGSTSDCEPEFICWLWLPGVDLPIPIYSTC